MHVGGGGAWPEHASRRPIGGCRKDCGAWPGFETTRRAKLAARTARGRAAAHEHTKQPGPDITPARQGNQTKSGGPQENLGTTTHAFTDVN